MVVAIVGLISLAESHMMAIPLLRVLISFLKFHVVICVCRRVNRFGTKPGLARYMQFPTGRMMRPLGRESRSAVNA